MTNLIINNRSINYVGDEKIPLLWFLRDEMGLTGTKFGCGIAMCGACTVHLNGIPIRSCQISISEVEGKKITTIESIGNTVIGKAIQDAWHELDVVQCGYCQSGQIMSATALLSEKGKPTDADIDFAMSGNVCRCATYIRIRKAIHLASEKISKGKSDDS